MKSLGKFFAATRELPPNDVLATIVAQVDEARGTAEQEDDITLVHTALPLE